jgi:hypothetical protein
MVVLGLHNAGEPRRPVEVIPKWAKRPQLAARARFHPGAGRLTHQAGPHRASPATRAMPAGAWRVQSLLHSGLANRAEQALSEADVQDLVHAVLAHAALSNPGAAGDDSDGIAIRRGPGPGETKVLWIVIVPSETFSRLDHEQPGRNRRACEES